MLVITFIYVYIRNIVMKINKEYTLVAYRSWEDENDKVVFSTKTKRGVVGLMKTIMDNFHPVHVDIMLDQD